MKFDEALVEMENGKSVKLPDQSYSLCMIKKIYYDNNPDRPCEMLSSEAHILRDDWEVVK